jgi:predicted dehydrogenase
MKKKVSIGVIGCGAVARFHVVSVLAAENATLAGVADVRRESAELFAKEYGTVAYPSVEAMLADPSVDAVCICTPSGFHANGAIAALEAGKHILVEKPLAVTVEDCDRVIALAKEKGLTAGVISQFRFASSVQHLRDMVKEGRLGKLITGELLTKYYRSQEYYDSSAWRGTWALDGGSLMNQGIHGVDAILYLLGPAESVCGYMDTMTHDMEAEDAAVAAVKFGCGALVVIQSTTSAYKGAPRHISVVGTKGSVVITEDTIEKCDVEGYDFEPVTEENGAKNLGHQNPMDISCDGHKLQIRDFADAILAGREPLVPLAESRRAVALIQGVYESARTRKVVKLD